MLRGFLLLLVAVFAWSDVGLSQLASVKRVTQVTFYRTTVGTTAAVAIPPANVGANPLVYKVCNDAVNTSTHLFVGEAADPSTDGVMLGKGECFVCEECQAGTLTDLRVIAQAADNGYTVTQYRQ